MIRSAAIAAACLGLCGCADLGYYAQAIEGQSEMLAARRPIRELVADPATDATLRRQLEQADAIREFASRELALPDNGSYRAYARLGRPYVVWNVFAAPALSLEPKQWCLLVVGCVGYRGYFAERDADRLAANLQAQGLDTHVAGIAAYSTLGFFDDPVLDTFLRLGEQRVAQIMFHELAHQLVYAPGDTSFNESFAVAVEEEGMRRWLARTGTPEQQRQFEAQRVRQAEVDRLLADCRERLRAIYASSLAPEEKLRAKAATLEGLRRDYAALRSGWQGGSGYDRLFAQPLNNALLASLSLYTRWLPSFRRLLAQEDGELPRFYRRVAALARLPAAERAKVLAELAAPTEPERASPVAAQAH